jgi:hypothetical protein
MKQKEQFLIRMRNVKVWVEYNGTGSDKRAFKKKVSVPGRFGENQ